MLLIADSTRSLPLKTGIARLVYADPPYECDPLDYEILSEGWLKSAYGLLQSEGWLIIATHYTVRYIVEKIARTWLVLDQECVWAYNFGTYTRKQFVPSHDTILIFKKGQPSFYWLPIAVKSQRLKASDKRADPRGRTPGTVWNYPRVPGNSLDRRDSYSRSSQPEDLCERIIKAYTKSGDLIVDLFCGSGTMPYVCRRLGRDCVSIDNNENRIFETVDRMHNEPKRFFESI